MQIGFQVPPGFVQPIANYGFDQSQFHNRSSLRHITKQTSWGKDFQNHIINDAIRKVAEDRKGWANIPAKSNRRNSFVFWKWLYRYRNRVECFFNKLKQFRGIATRYGKSPNNFLAAIKIASVRIWIKTLSV